MSIFGTKPKSEMQDVEPTKGEKPEGSVADEGADQSRRAYSMMGSAGRDQAAASSRSFIGGDLTITGDLQSKGDLEIIGDVHGNIRCKSVVIGEGATIEGVVVAEEATISGCITGPIFSERVELKPSCHVEGEIHHKSLAIDQGAYFEGMSRKSDDPIASAAKSGAFGKKVGTSTAGPTNGNLPYGSHRASG